MAVKEIREFNRFRTNRIGAPDDSRHPHTPSTPTEARGLYELAHAPRTDAVGLVALYYPLCSGPEPHLARRANEPTSTGMATAPLPDGALDPLGPRVTRRCPARRPGPAPHRKSRPHPGGPETAELGFASSEHRVTIGIDRSGGCGAHLRGTSRN
jgi:hypothetical protein